MRWRLAALLLLVALVVLMPGANAAACRLAYTDPAGDATPALAQYDLLGFEAVVGDDEVWWRIHAALLDATTNSVQYGGQIDTGEREGPGDGTPVLYHPLCPLDLVAAVETSLGAGAPHCHLSRSHEVGANAVSFEFVAMLDARLEPGGWLNVTLPFALLGITSGAGLSDLRSYAQLAVVQPDGTPSRPPSTLTPVVTDEQGSGTDTMPCGGPAGEAVERPPSSTDPSKKRAPGPMIGTLAVALLVLAGRRRG